MRTWRYTAVAAERTGVIRGEHPGETAGEVRSALHRAGLRVLDLKPLRRAPAVTGSPRGGVVAVARRQFERHLRSRRGPRKAESLDAIATMIEAGVPLAEAVASVASSTGERAGRAMLAQLRDQLHGGVSLADAVGTHPSWFDQAEAAMIRAGQQSGELPGVLRSLADRHARAGELAGRLASALAYPAIVAAVGVGVVIFLSTKTLPELAGVLEAAGRETPALTVAVMSFGRFLLVATPWIAAGLVLLAPVLLVIAVSAGRLGLPEPRWPEFLTPRVIRRAAVAEMLLSLSELLRTGVPAVDSLRVIAPAAGGIVAGRLGALLEDGASRIERGESIADAFADRRWFPDEVERLIRIGEQSGELDAVLERLGLRYRRSARRLIDRLAALLEPAVILALAVGVGVVVMAAVLPLVRLQEML